MPITDPQAIKFCNERIRPGADRMARCKYRAGELNAEWKALSGTWQEKFDLLALKIERVGDLLTNTLRFLWWSDQLWLGLSLQSLFPDDPNEAVWDGPGGTGPDPSRPPLTGQIVRQNKRRQEEMVNWLSRSSGIVQTWITDTQVTVEVLGYEYFRDFARVGSEAPNTTAAQAKLVADDRCGQILTEYQTTNPGKFTQILKAAVNPQETEV